MSRTVVIFSTKGGVGNTLIASNIAVSLVKNEARKVCLIDLDLEGVGDMARMLGAKPEKGMLEFLTLLKRQPEGARKENFLTRYAANLDFLPGVLKPQLTPHFEASRMKDVFSLLEKDYDYIIVDGGKGFNDTLINALNLANLILLVVSPDILSIYQTKWTLDTLQSLNFPLKMVKIILNRAESVSSISWQEISVALPCEILAQVPSEGKVAMQAVNQGIPVITSAPRSKISLSITKLTSDFMNRSDLFVEHSEVGALRSQTAGLEKPGEFWERVGLTAGMNEAQIIRIEDEVITLKSKIHERLIDELDIKKLNVSKLTELREKAEKIVSNLLVDMGGKFIASQEVRKKLVKEIIDEALGLGALEDLLRDDSITDIMVNNKDEVYIERKGRIELTSKKFISNDQIKTVIERIIAPIGRHIDESVPLVDARLPDGSRVNAIIPPLSLTGPTLTIRKFRKEKYKAEELVEMGTVSSGMIQFLNACVLARKNIIISGGTGSGKTTILNLFSNFIPNEERIITIEDAAELKLNQEHWVRLEARPPNIEGKGAISIRDIFRNTLRMRPDRIIIGECRGLETLDMLQAMNTGHDGSMTTVHANSTHDVLSRLDSMILMSGVELPIRAIREMIASAIDIIVHTARLSDGTRKIMQITEVAGMLDEVHVSLKDIFSFRPTGIDAKKNIMGDFHFTGYMPSFIEDIKIKGIVLSDDVFKK